jgi:diguanylate cyclase (GGDEF)-like protein
MKKILSDRTTWKLMAWALLGTIVYGVMVERFSVLKEPAARVDDFFVRLVVPARKAPDQVRDIVILAVDNDSIDYSNTRWPWRRGFTAGIIDRLAEMSPRGVFLDFVLSGRSEPEEDILLQESLRNLGRVYIASYIDKSGLPMLPHPLFMDAALDAGFITNPVDRDGVIRRSRMLTLSMVSVEPVVGDYSGVLKLYCLNKSISPEALVYNDLTKTIEVSSALEHAAVIPLAKDRSLDINFRFPPDQFTIVPAWKVFKDQVSADQFRDKLVLVGATAQLTHDQHMTPLGVLPGVVIKAYELSTLLSERYVKAVPYAVQYGILFLLVAVVAVMSYRFPLSKGLALFLTVGAGYYLWYAVMAFRDYRLDGFAPILMGGVSYIGVNFYKQVRLRHDINKLQLLAVTDSITGAYVRRYFQLRLQYEWMAVKKSRNVFSLLMLDIDYFKKVNDTYGHLCGDMVLAKVALIIQECCRKVDVICRYGGEEFAIILPQTDLEGALVCARKIRSSVEETEFQYNDQTVRVTVSLGAATYAGEGVGSAEQLLERADTCLYRAKETGRNRVVSG